MWKPPSPLWFSSSFASNLLHGGLRPPFQHASMPNFPNVVRGKPTLSLTSKELDEAIADAEESYVFGSGMDRDKHLSTSLQEMRDFRQERGIEVVQSRLIISRERWEFFGGWTRVNPQFGAGNREYGYLCVLPTNEVVPHGGTGVWNFLPIIFASPVTGYLVEFRHCDNWDRIREWLNQEPFNAFVEMICDARDVPYGQFNDPPDLDLD